MQNILKSKTMRACRTLAIWVLIAAMLIQPLSVSGLTLRGAAELLGGSSNPGGILSGPSSGIGMLQGDKATLQLKKELIKSLNQDLLYKVSELELSGRVGVILTFVIGSDARLITALYSLFTLHHFNKYRRGAEFADVACHITHNIFLSFGGVA